MTNLEGFLLCARCGNWKPTEAFHDSRTGQFSYCRECRNAYDRAYYAERGRAARLARRRAARAAARAWMASLKDGVPCADCGETFPVYVIPRMLIHKHDAALDDAEWHDFLATHDFGELIVPGAPTRDLPIVVPTHFLYDGDHTVYLHLARPNPVWEAIAERPRALLSVFGAYAYIPGHWNQDEYGVPTSYYAAVQLACDVATVDDDAGIAAILERQLGHFQPEGLHAPVEPGDNRYGKLLGSIRGLRLTVTDVRAKFKFGTNRTPPHRDAVAAKLAERATPLDREARAHTLRRLARQRG